MLRRLIKTLSSTFSLTFVVILAATNWFVHQPRHWQMAQSQKFPAYLAEWSASLGHASADVTDTLGLTGHDVTATLNTPLDTNSLVCAGLPVRLNTGTAPRDIAVLNKKGFIIGYSPSLRHPAWVVYKTYPSPGAGPFPRPSGFKPDPAVRNSPQHKDYAKTGYDRGHMAPNLAIATRYGKAAQAQTFLTSNICPQRAGLNQGPWRDLEFRISELWPDCYGEVWVITGAITTSSGRRLPSGINIPTAFYQIVVAQEQTRLRVFAVYIPQNIRRRAYVRSTLVSIDEIEKMTGLDFLADLPDAVETALEAATPTRLWPAGAVGAVKLLRERFRTYD